MKISVPNLIISFPPFSNPRFPPILRPLLQRPRLQRLLRPRLHRLLRPRMLPILKRLLTLLRPLLRKRLKQSKFLIDKSRKVLLMMMARKRLKSLQFLKSSLFLKSSQVLREKWCKVLLISVLARSQLINFRSRKRGKKLAPILSRSSVKMLRRSRPVLNLLTRLQNRMPIVKKGFLGPNALQAQ